jgi:FkbM family methyltransferase
MKNSRKSILSEYMGGEKLVLFDIGARYGVHSRWNKIADFLTVYAFEPDQNECDQINAAAKSLPYQLECLPYALGDSNQAVVPLYLCKDVACSSLYYPNLELVNQFNFGPSMAVTDEVEVSVHKLEDICQQRNLQADIIKVDTQGYELSILQGAGSLLDKVKLIEVEVEFNEQYKDQPLFSNVDLFMRSRGFSLLGLRRSCWRRKVDPEKLHTPFGGQIMHGDAIYYNEKLLQDAVNPLTITEMIKLCVLFSVYRQDDFIGYLLTHPHPAVNHLPVAERIRIAEALQNSPSGLSSLVAGFVGLARRLLRISHTSLRSLVDRTQSNKATDWHDPNFY